MLRVEPNPEVVAILKEIDRRRKGLTPITALSPEEQQRWAQEYAEDAAPHMASLDVLTDEQITSMSALLDREPGLHQVNMKNLRRP